MTAAKAFKIIEDYKARLLPNKKYSMQDLENALLSADEEFEMYVSPNLFKSEQIAFLAELILGVWGVGLFYVGKPVRGIVRLVMIILPSLVFSGIGMASGIANGYDVSSLNPPAFLLGLMGVYVLIFLITLIIDIAGIKKACRAANCKKLIDLAMAHPERNGGAYPDNTSLPADSVPSVNAEDLLDDITVGN